MSTVLIYLYSQNQFYHGKNDLLTWILNTHIKSFLSLSQQDECSKQKANDLVRRPAQTRNVIVP